MNKQVLINFKGKKIKLVVDECNWIGKSNGLMFSRREKANILLFNLDNKLENAIHSFFVFYPFVAIWLDKKNKVIDLKIVEPFCACICPKKIASKIIEIPINRKNKKILSLLDDD